MNVVTVQGYKKKHKVLMYTISTCAWCKMTKEFLKEKKIEYKYIDIDLCNDNDRETIRKEILKRGGSLSYPAILIDDKILINGFQKDKIIEALEI